ncbi:hypothetical protein JCM10450v2_002193 [Rhodotorula kratochvilovae]
MCGFQVQVAQVKGGGGHWALVPSGCVWTHTHSLCVVGHEQPPERRFSAAEKGKGREVPEEETGRGSTAATRSNCPCIVLGDSSDEEVEIVPSQSSRLGKPSDPCGSSSRRRASGRTCAGRGTAQSQLNGAEPGISLPPPGFPPPGSSFSSPAMARRAFLRAVAPLPGYSLCMTAHRLSTHLRCNKPACRFYISLYRKRSGPPWFVNYTKSRLEHGHAPNPKLLKNPAYRPPVSCADAKLALGAGGAAVEVDVGSLQEPLDSTEEQR